LPANVGITQRLKNNALICCAFMEIIQLKDKKFSLYIEENTIQAAVKKVAQDINNHWGNQNPLVVCVLGGAFMFTSDLVKHFDFNPEIGFVKLKSYKGTENTGKPEQKFDIEFDIKNRNVIVIEDIIDTGNTIQEIDRIFRAKGVKNLVVATLLYKPKAYKKTLPIDFVGIEIENDFIVGYGLDYDGFGRNLKNIYKIIE
jgi:hypoxanthine phosphoribosyltransferase